MCVARWLATYFVNKVLLEHSYTHLFMIICSCFYTMIAELNCSDNDWTLSLKYLLFGLWRKSSLAPGLWHSFSNMRKHTNHFGILLQCRSHSEGLTWDLCISVSKKFQEMPVHLVWEHTLSGIGLRYIIIYLLELVLSLGKICPTGTFSNFWRNFWLAHLRGHTIGIYWISPGMVSYNVQDKPLQEITAQHASSDAVKKPCIVSSD